jgi:hypothetical protein
MKCVKPWPALLLGSLLVFGCGQGGNHPEPSAGGGGSLSSAGPFVLDTEPAAAKGVIEVKEAAKDGEEVVVVGRIGGTLKPFTDNLASFTIVDPSLKSCLDKGETDAEAPWEFD